MDHPTRLSRFRQSDLYVVITGEFCAGRSPLAVLDAVLEAGVQVVQLREKDMPSRALYELAKAFRAHTATARALLIVNDRVDIALAVDADGVHLGQDDLPLETARRIAPELLIGASSHSLDEALAAQRAGASYVNIGPIYDTRTKAVPTGAIGPAALDRIAPHLEVPFTCMGGIKEHNIDEVVSRGARHVAVVTAVTAAPDIAEAAARLRRKIRLGA